jgi:hypothetical protein
MILDDILEAYKNQPIRLIQVVTDENGVEHEYPYMQGITEHYVDTEGKVIHSVTHHGLELI